jgi:hypothetical protein
MSAAPVAPPVGEPLGEPGNGFSPPAVGSMPSAEKLQVLLHRYHYLSSNFPGKEIHQNAPVIQKPVLGFRLQYKSQNSVLQSCI